MKLSYLLMLAVAIIALPACEQKKTTPEKIQDKVDDALDRRPGEKVKDAAEDIKDTVKDASEDVKDTVKDATK